MSAAAVPAAAPVPTTLPRVPVPPLREAWRVWARIALLSFGGPAGQVALMHREVVEARGWVSEGRFLHALAYCTLLPGPEAQQLAAYLGWLLHGVRGALVAGGLFVLPGALAMLALSALYATHGTAAPVAGLFLGLKAAVLAIVAQAVVRLARRALKGPVSVAVALAAFLALALLDAPFPLVIALAASAGTLEATGRLGAALPPPAPVLDDGLAPPPAAGARRAAGVILVLWLAPVAALVLWLGPESTLARIGVFFSGLALVTFGGAYAALAYVAQAAVETHGWLNPGEMLDGLGLAETTPGPLVLVMQFVGFLAAYRDPGALPPLLAGALGGLLATWATFAPCFVLVLGGAPYVEGLRGNRAVAGALRGVSAAVVGVIAHLALWFALHALFGRVEALRWGPLALEVPVAASLLPAPAALAALALALVFGARLSVVPVLLVLGALGVALRLSGLAG